MKDFIKTKIPLVVFDKDVYGLDVSTVVSENRNGAYKAINHLYNKGFKDIGIVSSDLKGIPCRIERISGYKEALIDNKMEIDEEKIFFFNEDLDFIPQMEETFSKRKMPRAVFTFNYQVTMEFLRFCKKSNIKIPEDVALIGFDDIPYAELFDVPVTVITQEDYNIGYRSAEILFDKIENSNEPEVIKETFPCELIIRKSCGSKL